MTRNRSKVGTRLQPDDRQYVLKTMEHPGESDTQFLRTHRFAVTKFGRLDRRTRMPVYRQREGVTPTQAARAEYMRMRSIVRAIVEEMKDE